MIDYRTLLYNALLNSLKTSPDLQAMNPLPLILDLKVKEDWQKKLFLDKAPDPTAFPRIDITNGRYTHSAYEQGLTLASEATDFLEQGGEWPLTRTAEFIVTMTIDSLLVNDINNMEEAVQLAFLKLGPGLGFDWVISWTMQGLQNLNQSGVNRDRNRLESQLRIIVTMLFDGSVFVRP